MDRTRIFHNHNYKIKLASSLAIQLVPLSPLSTKMVITVAVVHTEGTGPDDGIPWKLQVDWNRNEQRCHSNLESIEW